MRLTDLIRRWWNPAQWRDDHPEVSDGEALTEEQRKDLGEHEHGERSAFRPPPGVALPSEFDQNRDFDDP